MSANIEEVWKTISDSPKYQVSNFGMVKRIKSGKILKPHIGNTGYCYVDIYNGKIRKNSTVHRLVAKEFIHNYHNKLFVNHIDGVKTNNNVCNLEWCTKSENQIHAFKNGMLDIKRGIDNYWSKLDRTQVLTIRSLNGILSQKDISIYFKIVKSTARKIMLNLSYKEIS